MHKESFEKMKLFVQEYLKNYCENNLIIGELGSRDLNGSYKNLFDCKNWEYIGLDIEKGKNVDIVLTEPYNWKEIKDNFFDVVISGQTFEHIEFPWLTIKEIYRVLKPNGLFCIIAPSKGKEHKVPVDCWRFYPDGIKALAKWAGFKLVEVFTEFNAGEWGDTFGVMQKITNSNLKKSIIDIQKPKNLKNKLSNNSLSDRDSLSEKEILDSIKNDLPNSNIASRLNLGLVYMNFNYFEDFIRIFSGSLKYQMNKKICNRTTIIQTLINKFRYKNYLEIGVERGLNFFQIDVDKKAGVDPNFRFDITKFSDRNDLLLCKMTSDEFFKNIPDFVKNEGLDIVFIDGLHTYEQSLRDIENSLNFLNKDGVIVVHDCYPKEPVEALPTLELAKADKNYKGSWLGEVYKTVIELRVKRNDLFFCVIDCDCGVGIIKFGKPENKLNIPYEEVKRMNFDKFKENSEYLLNLKPSWWIWDFPYNIFLKEYNKIAIFGLGKSGKMTYEFIKEYFPEKIKYFIDDNVKGEYEGVPIVTTDEFLEKYQDKVDAVVFGKYQHLNPKLLPNLKIAYLRLENIE